jgi:16S rRNA G966 N2-methylase RsmD
MTYYRYIIPIDTPIRAKRQGAKRHYGVHPYFTRRPYNVVKDYILHYSQEGDKVIDPFGGSGVTAIEAFLENRIGIHNDINPLANFIAQGIVNLHHGTTAEYLSALSELKNRCQVRIEQIEAADESSLHELEQKVKLPPNLPLPKNSDVETYHELFLPQQLLALATLKDAIDAIQNEYVRNGLLLAWSATLTKLNKTFLSAKGRLASRGGSSLFSIYRYKVAKNPVTLPAWPTFFERATNIIAAKKEIDAAIELKNRTVGWKGEFITYANDIEEISDMYQGQIDYIYTDPPYGAHIAYLDLSTLWNGWLGHLPSQKAKENELIVGGDFKHSESEYIERLGKSIKACARMLKPDRWMSVVFQHWQTKYFEAILVAASESGMELRAAISQVGDPIWSMHKKKGSKSVLAGELILTFFSTGRVTNIKRTNQFDVETSIANILKSVKTGQVYGEYLFNQVVMKAWEKGAISALSISKQDFTDMIKRQGWNYDCNNHNWVRDGVSSSCELQLGI